MKLYIIRHGETEWNKLKKVQGHSDIPLNEWGIHLARETRKGLSQIHFHRAYTSPLVRARQTAELVLEGRDIMLYEDHRIKEIGFGEAEGMPYHKESVLKEEIEFNKFFTDPKNYVAPAGGESIQQLNSRVSLFLQEIYADKELADKNILLSTHGATYTAILNLMRGDVDVAQFWTYGVPANCAVAEVEVNGEKPVIVEMGKVYY